MSTPARRLRETRATAQQAPDGSDLRALEDVSSAVEAGTGLPEVVRAAARALDASLLLSDPSGAVLAVAARSPADEQSLSNEVAGVEVLELRVAALFLSLYVGAAFVGVGIAGGAAVIWFWDRI